MAEINEATPLTHSIEIPEITLENFLDLFGLPLQDAYKLAIKYYRENERSGELQVEYPVRLQFMAYSKQAKYGIFNEEVADCGWFDLVGNDSKREWKKLGDLSQDQAMLEFVRLLDVVCPAFKPHIQEKLAIENSKQSIDSIQNSANPSAAAANYSHLINGGLESKEVLEKYQLQRQQIQEALNKQTYHQFLAYAQQTHPGEPQKQAELISSLQAEHFAQYMSQVYAAQQAQAEAEARRNGESSSDSEVGQRPKDSYMQEGLEHARPKGESGDSTEVSDEEPGEDLPSNPKIAPASLWNRKDIQEFKAAIKKEGPDGILKIGHGETVTVRVPTHEEGTCLFWEFSTDYYDIGFGVYFEWTISETNQVSVIVSESDDEEYEDEAEVSGATGGANDVESAAAARQKQRDPNKPQVDEIIPVYRRDSHEEVYAGSHVYPGRGVYLLKFDNSYSLWRSKTLYYRVYYSK
uniref:Golgi resident protein GCP60 n=1 Tax=Acrobeloides nanus TaxID=290746 RepID=A0A914DCX9_9BILA